MAPYKDVKSLFDLALHSLGNCIGSVTVSVLEKFHGQKKNENAEESRNLQVFIKKTVEYYDTNIPPSLHNILTFYSLIHTVSHFGTNALYFIDIETLGILDIAVRAHITKLNFSKWPHYIELYLYKNLSRFEKLKLLEFSEKSHFTHRSEFIFTCIQSMKNLQSFVCPSCNDAMLEMLSNNCTLQNLDISSSYSVSDASVSSLLKMQSLKILQLSHKFSLDACKRIILGLPNLIYVSCYRLNEVLAQITENVLSLQYVHYDSYSQKDVTNLINLCPNIKKLCISLCRYNIDCSNLVTLQNLTCLAVSFCGGFYKSGIKFILESQGYHISDLELRAVDEISVKTLHEISTLCPKLNTLVLKDVYVHEQPALPTENKMLFPNLEYLYCDIYPSTHHSAILLFLHNCISIKTAKFENFEGITEKDFLSVFLYNHLEKLEEFMFPTNNLTVRSILELISSCKQLKRIGYLAKWSNFSGSAIQLLHDYVRDNNLDVELLDYKDKNKEQVSVMKSSRLEFTVKSRFTGTGRKFFIVEEDL